jgi:ferric-dicitrate binding protein FerR (iron transport regulator)
MIKEDQFWTLVSLKLSGEATADELATLDRLLEQDPEWTCRLDALGDYWTHAAPTSGPRMKKGALQRHLQRLNQIEHLPPSRRGGPRRFFLFALGIAASLAGFAFFVYHYQSSPKKQAPPVVAQNTISTKPGSKSKIQLPDGSQVWLNADSRLVYSESFGGTAREVCLSGEAYFDVAKDPGHPFIIHTKTIDVLVLGTTLNVRSYSNEKNTEAVLIHGSVEVSLRNDPAKKIIMRPNDKLVVKNGEHLVLSNMGKTAKSEFDSSRILSLSKAHIEKKDSVVVDVLWTKNKLAFDQESLETVALKIERWFNVKVNITNDALRQTEYSGVFEDEALPQVMEALRLTGSFRYAIRRREVTIRP